MRFKNSGKEDVSLLMVINGSNFCSFALKYANPVGIVDRSLVQNYVHFG